MTRGKPKSFPKPAAPPKPSETLTVEASQEEPGQSFPSEPRQEQRLQKIIAAAGLTSRRKAEEFILNGRVQVNGATITELGTKADPTRDHIRVDGKLLRPVDRFHYYILNKPKGYITSASDPEGRPTVMDFFERTPVRVYPVGRLDYQSEGLLVMTNDGELANLLTKASSKVEKTYLVKIAGVPTEAALQQLRGGIMIERGKQGSHEGRVLTQPARIRMARDAENPWYEVILTEGRNREIRKMFEEIGHFVEKIRRVGYGPLVLDIPPGEIRELDATEVTALQRAARGIISRVRPPAIKLPAAKRTVPRRRNLSEPPARTSESPEPTPPAAASARQRAVTEATPRPFPIRHVPDESPARPPQRSARPSESSARPPQHSAKSAERSARPSERSGRPPERSARVPRSDSRSRSVNTKFSGQSSGPGSKRNARPPAGRADARPSTGRSNSRDSKPRFDEQASIDPRTGSPYRVLFGDRPGASKSASPRTPATFDLRKAGTRSPKQDADSRPKSGARPPATGKAKPARESRHKGPR